MSLFTNASSLVNRGILATDSSDYKRKDLQQNGFA